MDIFQFIEQAALFGLEYFKIYPGVYRAQVVSNSDPENRGRIQIVCPAVGHNVPSPVWVKPAMYGAGPNRGMFWPPEVDDTVYVSFRMGNASRPEFYLGGWYGYPDNVADVPEEMPYTNTRPEKRGFMTRAGHSIIFSDEPGNEYVRVTWHKPADGDQSLTDEKVTASRAAGEFSFIELTKDGSVTMSNKNGSSMFLNADGENITLVSEQGHSITLTEEGINIVDKEGNLVNLSGGDVGIVAKGGVNVRGASMNIGTGGVFLGDPATFSAVLGEQLLTWLSTHVHGTGVGPSSPPVVPPPPSVLSQSVKLKS